MNQLPFIKPFLNLQNGKFAVAGSYDGRCVFYTTEHLKYYTQIHVRSTRGRNSKGRKITGIEPLPNEDKVLLSSNLYFYTVWKIYPPVLRHASLKFIKLKMQRRNNKIIIIIIIL